MKTTRQSLLDLFERVDRRTFLKAAGVFGGAAVIGGGVLRSALRVLGDEPAVTRMRPAMGTFVEISAVCDSPDLAEDAMNQAFAEMDRLVAVLSRHDSGSPLSYLNAHGRLTGAPRELGDVILAALDVHRRTAGAFDPTVAPLVELLETSRGGGLPSTADIAAALELVGADGIEFDDRGVRLARAGMRVTLDGIAKGFIVDRMSGVLSAAGVGSHLVNAGGDIRARGERAPGRPWRIAIEDPQKKGDYPAVIRMRDGAVATSGSYENFFDRAHTRHHIVTPHSGVSPTQLVSATVRARSVTEADALSTAVFVMGPEAGIAFAAANPGVETYALDGNRRVYATPGIGG